VPITEVLREVKPPPVVGFGHHTPVYAWEKYIIIPRKLFHSRPSTHSAR
jgi:hypothetical protein